MFFEANSQNSFDRQTLATEEEINFYMNGGCWYMAVALARECGWGLVVALDPRTDLAGEMPIIYHVYADDGAEGLWDICGVRKHSEARLEIWERSKITCRFENVEPKAFIEIIHPRDIPRRDVAVRTFERDVARAAKVMRRALSPFIDSKSGTGLTL